MAYSVFPRLRTKISIWLPWRGGDGDEMMEEGHLSRSNCSSPSPLSRLVSLSPPCVGALMESCHSCIVSSDVGSIVYDTKRTCQGVVASSVNPRATPSITWHPCPRRVGGSAPRKAVERSNQHPARAALWVLTGKNFRGSARVDPPNLEISVSSKH